MDREWWKKERKNKFYPTDGGRGRSASHSGYGQVSYGPGYHQSSGYPRGKVDKTPPHSNMPLPSGSADGPGNPPAALPFHPGGGPPYGSPHSMAPPHPHASGMMPGMHPHSSMQASQGPPQPFYGYHAPPAGQPGNPNMYPYRGYPGQRPPNPNAHKPNNYSGASPVPVPHGGSSMAAAQPYPAPHPMSHAHTHPHPGSPHLRPRDKPTGTIPTSAAPALVTGTSPIGSGVPPALAAHQSWGHPQYYSPVPGQFDPNTAPQGYYRPPPPGAMYPYPPPYPMAPGPPPTGSPMSVNAVPQPMSSRLNTSAPAFSPGPKVNKAIRIVNPETKQELDLKNPVLIGSPAKREVSPVIRTGQQASNDTTTSEAEAKPTFVTPTRRPVSIVAPSEAKKLSDPEPASTDAPVSVETPEADEMDVDEPGKTSDSEPETISVRVNDLAKFNANEADDLVAQLEGLSVKEPEASDETPEVVPEEAPEAPEATPMEMEETPIAEPVEPVVPETIETSTEPKEQPAEEAAEVAEEPAETVADDVTDTDQADAETDDEEAVEEQEEDEVPSQETDAAPSGPAKMMMLDVSSLDKVQYPPNMATPTAEKGILKYNREFLLQFQSLCTEKPVQLNKEVVAATEEAGGHTDRRSTNANRRGMTANRGSAKGGVFPENSGMGNFNHVPRTSADRFANSNMRNLSGTSYPGSMGAGMHIGPRSASTSHMQSRNSGMGNREGRSSRRGEKKKGYGNQPTGANPTPIENVKPLEKSANRWTPRTVGEGTKKEATSDDGIPSNEVIIRKVKSLLNKLTLEKFESISNQIVDFARLSAKTGNGQILELVIQLIFEKAIDEMNFCSIYALLCQNMMGRLDDVRSDDYKNNKGEPLAGSQLFRRYLLSRCQFEFEKGWRLDTEGIDVTDPSFIMSDQYYELQKQKRHGLGLVAFVGELYKKGMLSDKVVHGCIIKLLSNFENPVEEEVESLCKLMTTCGKQISESKVLSLNMDKYFRAIQALSVNKNLPSRFRCLLLDVIDLRKANWVDKKNAGPKTIAEIHEDAAREKEESQMQLRKSASSSGRGMPNLQQQLGGRGYGDRRGQRSLTPGGLDGWNNNAGASRKTGDLSRFGNLSNLKGSATPSLGPSGGLFGSLGGGSRGWKEEGQSGGNAPRRPPHSSGASTPQLSRSNSHIGTSNKFSALANVGDMMGAKEPTAEEPNVGKSPTGLSPVQKSASMRPRFNLLPRGSTTGDVAVAPATSTGDEAVPSSASTPAGPTSETLNKPVKSMLLEYQGLKDLEEVKMCLEEMGGTEAHAPIVCEMFKVALDKGDKMVDTIAELLPKLTGAEAIARGQLVAGLAQFAELIEDLAMDFPRVHHYVGRVLACSKVTVDELRQVLRPLENPTSMSPPALPVIKEWLLARESTVASLREELSTSSFDVSVYFPTDGRTPEAIQRTLDLKDMSDYIPLL